MTGKFPLFPSLDTTTIVPQGEEFFIPYFNTLYQDIASAVNFKDNTFYPMAISSTAANIINLPNFGAFIICVSGESPDINITTGAIQGYLPTLTASLCKASATASGSIAVLGSQVGTGTWAGNALTITSTATNFQIAHNRAGVTANFNLRIIGTQ